MSTFPILPEAKIERESRRLPDYLPARMVNEFVYCPRLFFYEWVDGLFQGSADTEEGQVQHRRVDQEGGRLPAPEELGEEKIHTRSVTLSSETYRLIAKMDLLEVDGRTVTPVDYKHGKPREKGDGVELWPTDRVQLAVQALVLRDSGYQCEEGVVYYAATKQRVRVVFDEELISETLRAVRAAWETAAHGVIPPPLMDSPKCGGCSLVGICLPDETNALRNRSAVEEYGQLTLFPDGAKSEGVAGEVGARRLIAARVDTRPVYLNTQGLRVGKSGASCR